MENNQSMTLVLGFCEDGPYKYANSLLCNSEVQWVPWSYHVGNIDPRVIDRLSNGLSLKDRKVVFSSWSSNFSGNVPVLRFGRIDHFTFNGTVLSLTVHLEAYNEADKAKGVMIKDPKMLCFYL